MVLIGLLLIALVCLALGLVLANAAWLIGSLAASAAAAWVLWRGRNRVVADAPEQGETGAAEVGASADAAADAETSGVEIDIDELAEPDYARRRADELSGIAQPERAAVATAIKVMPPADPQVWVIDGRPNYHTAHCGVLLGADGEEIPRSQAVEDGFTPCTLCDPDAHLEPVGVPDGDQGGDAAEAPPTEASAELQVWVVDGWPHYHDAGCGLLAGYDGEPVPHAQAVEDGFTPCPTCRPAADGAADEPFAPVAEPEAEPAEHEPEAAEHEPEVAAEAETVEETEPAADTEPAEAEALETEACAEDEPVEETAPVEETEPVAEVWVVRGRPRYHRPDCLIVEEQGPIALPYSQAVEEGFQPCSLCEPDADL